MAQFWMPSTGKLYLPPPTPITRILHTDEFVTRTNMYYHAKSERLLTVGHPYYPIKKQDKIVVPKVSGNQFRVFNIKLPDPNKFALSDTKIYDPETERLVWAMRGAEIGRGQPLGLGSTGHPYFNKLGDTENPVLYTNATDDDRQNISFDPKQIQMFIFGCTPCDGEYWDRAKFCAGEDHQKGDCPPIELKTAVIQDGDMCDIGLGAMNFKALQETRSGATLDTVTEICKYPDFLKMNDDAYGNSCFFYGKREQSYARHYWVRSGTTGDDVPSDHFMSPSNGQRMGPVTYFNTPSGSLVSSETQLFNRPYWLQRAQGKNNGICWANRLFVTVVDNTRNTNFTISIRAENTEQELESQTYKASDFKQYSRHVEEYELGFIFQLCKVTLTADVLAHIHAMDSTILDDWNLGFVAPPGSLEDQYRYITSLATKCPSDVPPKDKEDPYKDYTFWDVDLTEKFTTDLEQHALGRKFLFQSSLRGTKRPASRSVSFKNSKGVKRRKKTAT